MTRAVLVTAILIAVFVIDPVAQVGEVKVSSSWNVQSISDSIFAPAFIVVDSHEQPHIAYTKWVMGNPHNKSDWSPRDGLDSVIYMSWNGTAWLNQTVATDAAVLDLVLDSHDNAHILYKSLWGTTDQHLMYAKWTSNDWNIQDTGAQGIYHASIALDSKDNPHIAFIDSTYGNFVLKYFDWSGPPQIIDSYDIGFNCNLKLDSKDNPHILYQSTVAHVNGSDQELVRYAFKTATAWNTQNTFQVKDQNIEFSSMVLDQNGYPYFSYGYNIVNWNGSGWSTNSFRSAFNSSISYGGSFVTLDKQGHPNVEVVIGCEGASEIAFVRWTGDKWVSSPVYLNPDYFGPLTLDLRGNPFLLFYKGVGGYPPLEGLVYATELDNGKSIPEFPAALIITLMLMISLAFVIALISMTRYPKVS